MISNAGKKSALVAVPLGVLGLGLWLHASWPSCYQGFSSGMSFPTATRLAHHWTVLWGGPCLGMVAAVASVATWQKRRLRQGLVAISLISATVSFVILLYGSMVPMARWEYRVWKTEREAITLSGAGHASAGDYLLGGPSGLSVILAEDSFVFESAGCTGVALRVSGTVQQTPKGVDLIPAPEQSTSWEGGKLHLDIVPWGQRRYAVLEWDSFCHAVAAGYEPRVEPDGLALLRWGDSEKPAPGYPNVPHRLRNCFLGPPENIRVKSVDAEARTLELDAGFETGLTGSTNLTLRCDSGSTVRARVVDSNPTVASAVLIEQEVDVQVGWCSVTEYSYGLPAEPRPLKHTVLLIRDGIANAAPFHRPPEPALRSRSRRSAHRSARQVAASTRTGSSPPIHAPG